MSPNVGNFVHDLVEMAKAMEELPQVQAKLEAELARASQYADRIQSLELRIIDLKNSNDEKLSTIRSLEVARDDAELWFLEADDRANHGLVALRSIQAALEEKLMVLDPVKAEEPKPTVAEAVQSVEEVQVQPTWPDPVYPQPEAVHTGDPANVDSWASGPGQSEPLPTAALPTGEYTAQSQSADEQVDASSPQPLKPFANKLYHDHPTWVSYEDWIAGGGNDYSYAWRPAQTSSGF